MQDSINTHQQLVGTQLECIQTQCQVTITEYAEDFWTGTERFEGFRILYPNGMTHIISCDRVGKDYAIPSTKSTKSTNFATPFVLASLFEVETMTSDIPLEVYEQDPFIAFTECPDCDGQGWIEVEGSAWYNSAWAFHQFTSMKPCQACYCEGKVLISEEATWLLAA